MANIIVLGAGLVGGVMAKDLAKNHNITSVDISQKNLDVLDGIKTICADVSDTATLQNLIKDFDLDKMNAACTYLMGEQDFTSFSKLNTDTFTNNCHITKAVWTKESDIFVFTISANRFLRNMVRSVVGTLLDVGTGKIQVDTVQQIIEKKDRGAAGTSVPAKALFLTEIKYPKDPTAVTKLIAIVLFDNGKCFPTIDIGILIAVPPRPIPTRRPISI